MSRLILIRGPLGVGKSTVAQSLAQQLHGMYVSIDAILEELDLDKVDGECISAENFIAANKHVLPQIKQSLTDGVNVIVDGNFYHPEQIQHLTTDLPHTIFTLKAPLEVCIARDAQREHPYGEAAANAVFSLVSRHDAGITLETESKSADEVMQEMLTYLQ